VLCGSPTAVEIALSIRARLNLYRLADDSSLFDALTQAAKQAEIDAIARFDGVIASSSVLEHHARQLSARQVLLVSNGVDRELFERAAPPPAVISDLPKPIILYAGAVESWFNWQLVDQSARARPSYSFVIVGRIGSRPPANIPSNVLLLGQRPYSEMPAFMQAASVGIIPFGSGDGAKAIRAINPLKLYEYLAAGRPVVSSVQPPNVNCPGLFVYSDQSSFLDCLDKAVSLNRSATKITAPRSVDWAEIVKDLLKRVGLPYKAPAAP
jgi:glycosyltransferase involved in cell wall biosynthesis